MQKLTTEELQELQTIKQTYSQIIVNLGQVSIERIGLDTKQEQLNQFYLKLDDFEKTVKQSLTELTEKEKAFGKLLNEKYGDCEVNPETGEIINK